MAGCLYAATPVTDLETRDGELMVATISNDILTVHGSTFDPEPVNDIYILIFSDLEGYIWSEVGIMDADDPLSRVAAGSIEESSFIYRQKNHLASNVVNILFINQTSGTISGIDIHSLSDSNNPNHPWKDAITTDTPPAITLEPGEQTSIAVRFDANGWKYGTYPDDEYEAETPNEDYNIQLSFNVGGITPTFYSNAAILKVKPEDYFKVGVTTLTADETVASLDYNEFIWRYVLSDDIDSHYIELGSIFEEENGKLVMLVENHGPNLYRFETEKDTKEQFPLVDFETHLNVEEGYEDILSPGMINGVVVPFASPSEEIIYLTDYNDVTKGENIYVYYSLNATNKLSNDSHLQERDDGDTGVMDTDVRILSDIQNNPGSSVGHLTNVNGKIPILADASDTVGGTVLFAERDNDPLNCGLVRTYDHWITLDGSRPAQNQIEVLPTMVEMNIPVSTLQSIATGGEEAWNTYFDTAEINDIPFDRAFFANPLGISIYKVGKLYGGEIQEKTDIFKAVYNAGEYAATKMFKVTKYFDESVGLNGEYIVHIELPIFIANGPFSQEDPIRTQSFTGNDNSRHYLVYFDGEADDKVYDPFGIGTGPELQSPVPVSPTDHETDVAYGTNQTISWTCDTPDPDSTTYAVYFSTNQSDVFNEVASCRIATDLTALNVQTDLEAGTTYYVAVRATCGDDSAYRMWTFTTRPLPFDFPPITNPGPADGAVNQPVETVKLTEPLDSLTLTWNQVSGGITGWSMFLAGSAAELEMNETGNDFVGEDVLHLGTLLSANEEEGTTEHIGVMTEVEKEPSDSYLLYGTTYYWRVVAIAGEEPQRALGTSVIDICPGPIWSFTTRPRTMDITGNTTNINSSQGMTTLWDFGTADMDVNSVTYDIFLSTTPGELQDGAEPVIDPIKTDLSTPTCSFGDLEPGTTYYWMVKSTVETHEEAVGTMPASGTEVFYSEVFSFTTASLGGDNDVPPVSDDGNCNVGSFPAAFGLLVVPLMFLLKK